MTPSLEHQAPEHIRPEFSRSDSSGVSLARPETAERELAEQRFIERRARGGAAAGGRERRQFANSHQELSPPAQELALAIDAYKLRTHRRFITYEEMLSVVLSLGYRREG